MADRPKSVSVEEVEAALADPGIPRKVLRQFLDFGSVMVSELQDRGAALDGKATNLLGWSGAILAFLAIGAESNIQTRGLALGFYAGAAVAALGAAIFAAWSLKVRSWSWPSESDWFSLECVGGGIRTLLAFHAVALLEAYQNSSRVLSDKGTKTYISQWLLAATVVLLAAGYAVTLCPSFS